MKKIIFTMPNGYVAVVHPTNDARFENESEDEFIARVMSISVPQDAIGVRIINAEDLPSSRRFRAAWKDAGSAIEIDLEAARAIVLQEADTKSGQIRAAYTAGISVDEKVSWPIKRAEALAYQASGSAADAPNLALEAQARGVPLAALVTKVLDKAAALSALEAAIAGRCGALQDAARAVTTVAELAAIDIESGWPA